MGLQRSASPRLRVMISGMIAGVPWQGGATWAVLQYVLGLRRLGHEVWFVEPIDPAAVQPDGVALERSRNAAYLRAVAAEFGFHGSAALLDQNRGRAAGVPYAELRRIAGRADVLLNISGMLTDPALLEPIRTRVYLDLDPAFNQLWHSVQGLDMRFAGHTHFATVGLNVGRPDCAVPTCGLPWITTPQPVVLERWPVATEPPHEALTTVANWRGYGSIEHRGVLYGQKAHSLRELIDLPARSAERFVLALAIHPDERCDLDALEHNGWKLIDPARACGTPARYHRFVRTSWAELGVAKSGYVHAACGWFSDRSICYLASGRPVIAQDTGYTAEIPTGEGLLAFRTVDDVLAGIDALRRNYPLHARAARGVAERCFDSDLVLPRLLDAVSA